MTVAQVDILEADLPACSIEWLKKRDKLAVGCYELVDGCTSERRGKLELYSISDKNKLTKGNRIYIFVQTVKMTRSNINHLDYDRCKKLVHERSIFVNWGPSKKT